MIKRVKEIVRKRQEDKQKIKEVEVKFNTAFEAIKPEKAFNTNSPAVVAANTEFRRMSSKVDKLREEIRSSIPTNYKG